MACHKEGGHQQESKQGEKPFKVNESFLHRLESEMQLYWNEIATANAELHVAPEFAVRPNVGLPATQQFVEIGAAVDRIAEILGYFSETDASLNDAYPLPLQARVPAVLDWEPLVRAILADRISHVPVAVISAKFHNALADAAVAAARMADCPRVVLTGGCFQNTRLTNRVRQRLAATGFQVYHHQEVPPGDGGIALGQILIAANKLEKSKSLENDRG